MFTLETLENLSREFQLPLEDVRRCAVEVDKRDDVVSPTGLLRAWLRREQGRKANAPRMSQGGSRETAAYFGWKSDGSLIRSHEPVRGAVTEYAGWLVREIREQLLTPAEVAALIHARGGEILAAFTAYGSPVLEDWAARDTIHGWGKAHAQSSLQQAVRSWGGRSQWTHDPLAWERVVERWKTREWRAA